MTPVAAVLYTVFVWWFSTGAILWLDRLPRATYRWSLLAMAGVAAAAVAGMAASLGQATPAGAVVGFTCALALWGWHELSFLTGFITGPRRAPCPPGATGWRRFTLAASTLIHHELALAATAAVLLAVSWGRPDPVAAWTFLVLLVCRLSAKLNLFLGVPHFTDAVLPEQLQHLKSYLARRPMNPLFPASILGGGALAAWAAWRALAPDATPYQATAYALIFALTALALIEHAFMVLPVPDATLWTWALPAGERAAAGGHLQKPFLAPEEAPPLAK
ncbi:MAG: putative photosynthetic complex assembly protein PuhE [Caulobacteraceae bacterium]